MSSPVLKNFKVLLFQLSGMLNKQDIEAIIFLEALPDFKSKSPLMILIELEMMGKISASKLFQLEELFKTIGRMDLAMRVKKFAKSQKKASKNSNSALDFLQEKEQAMSFSELKNYRTFLFQLSENLSKQDIEGIIYLEDLYLDFKGQSPLKIFLKLEMMGKISASKLSYLEEVFKSISRMDLAIKVKDFIKLQKKAIKKSGTTLKEMGQTLTTDMVQIRLFADQKTLQLMLIDHPELQQYTKSLQFILSQAVLLGYSEIVEKAVQMSNSHFKIQSQEFGAEVEGIHLISSYNGVI